MNMCSGISCICTTLAIGSASWVDGALDGVFQKVGRDILIPTWPKRELQIFSSIQATAASPCGKRGQSICFSTTTSAECVGVPT